MSEDHSYDVIIVGAGAAGLSTAISAGNAGARVLLLDAAPNWGGALHVATGWLSGAGTELQAQKGISDSPPEHLEDLIRISKGTINTDLASKAVQLMPSAIDWLMSSGFEVDPVYPVHGFNHEPYSKARYLVGVDAGKSILKVLEEQIQVLVASGMVDYRPEHTVVELLNEHAVVTGVRAVTQDKEQDFFGSAIVVATGGYNANPEMFSSLSGHKLYAADSYPYAQGQGHQLLEAVGGTLRGHENYWSSFGSVLESFQYPAPSLCRPEHRPEVRLPWEIYVNSYGERFMAEDEPSVDAREGALLGQPGSIRHIIFDEELLNQAPPLIPGWTSDDVRSRCGQHPMFHQAASLEELARLINVPEQKLVRTVNSYNSTLNQGDEFGRVFRPMAISQTPYYAVTVHATSITSTVGITVNNDLQVTRQDGRPIENLYALGELLGSGVLQGQAFCGGMLATPALAFGLELGAELARKLRVKH